MLDDSSEYYLVTELVIPDSVTSIGSYAFYNCTGLTTVTIGSDVVRIGSDTFYGCSSIVDVYYNGTVADWCSISFGNAYSNPMYYADNLYMLDDSSEYYLVTELVIPDSVASISSYAFYNCTGLTTVTIDSSVIKIATYAFYGCSSLDSVELLDSDNWYCSVNNEAIDVTDTEQNATWFSSTYPKYYWYKVSN